LLLTEYFSFEINVIIAVNLASVGINEARDYDELVKMDKFNF